MQNSKFFKFDSDLGADIVNCGSCWLLCDLRWLFGMCSCTQPFGTEQIRTRWNILDSTGMQRSKRVSELWMRCLRYSNQNWVFAGSYGVRAPCLNSCVYSQGEGSPYGQYPWTFKTPGLFTNTNTNTNTNTHDTWAKTLISATEHPNANQDI